MQKSLFTKYFAICVAVILVALTVLGSILLLISAQYFRSEKYDLLKKTTQNAVDYTISNYRTQDNQVILDADIINSYRILGRSIEAQVFLVNNSGQTLLVEGMHIQGDDSTADYLSGSDNAYSSVLLPYSIPENILKQVREDGEYFEVGTLGGIYKSQTYIYGAPVVLEDGTLIAYLFLSLIHI